MPLLREFVQHADTTTVAYVKLGDSRSAWRKWRDVGSFYREFDVAHHALLLPAAEQNNGSDDGLGGFNIGITGATWTQIGSGQTLPSSLIVNRWPCTLAQSWFTGAANNPQWNRFYILYSTAGFDMDISQAGGFGGQFKRGDPAQGRNISSVEFSLVADDTPRWLNTLLEVGYNGAENGAASQLFAAPQGTPVGSITRFTLNGPFSPPTGVNIRARLRHFSGTFSNSGHVLMNMRVNFAGSSGMVYAQVAQGGWSHTDHMRPDNNTDWKYTDAGITEWLANTIRTDYLIIDEEVGQNNNQPGAFQEWNGINSGTYGSNKQAVLLRWIEAAIASGYAPDHILVVSRVPWRGDGDNPARINSMRTATLALHASNAIQSTGVRGYVVYDQQTELESVGAAISNGAVLAQYRDDPIHQNFDGMVILGRTMWNAITRSDCDSIDFNNDTSLFDPLDIDAFLSVYSEGPCIPADTPGGCNDIDFNNDGSLFDPCDIDSFLLVFSEGPCTACGQ